MGILSTLKKESAGGWPHLADYLNEARLRETGALAALALALTAPPAEQKELAEAPDGAAILLDLACDLRVPKGSRLAATRCLLEAGTAQIGQLFIGAGDLVTDPRLGAAARKLVESGLPAALQIGGEIAQVSLAAGSFARSAHASASAVGNARAKELLAGAPQGHAGAAAALFAMGQGELAAGELEAWKKLLETTCAKNRAAPAAARRMGMAPPWPPNLPEAFAPYVQEAEKKNEGVVSADAAKNPALLKKAPPAAKGPAAPPAPKPPLPPGKTVAAPIKRSPTRSPIGAVMEVPTRLPPKPMEELKGRTMPSTKVPAPQRPHVEKKEEDPLLPSRPMNIVPLPPREVREIKVDPRGRKVPRPDRWRDDAFEWDAPVLPPSELPPPMRAAVAKGPFTQRVQSIFEDRPEAVDRLCAAAEARAAVAGEAHLAGELSSELSSKRWDGKRFPAEQLKRLRGIAEDGRQPLAWQGAARLLLERLGPKVS